MSSGDDQRSQQQAELDQATAEEPIAEQNTDQSSSEDGVNNANEPFYIAAGDEIGHRVAKILEELGDLTPEEVQATLDFEDELELFDIPADAEHLIHWF